MLSEIKTNKLPKKSYCDVIVSTFYRYINKITDQVKFDIKTDHYTAVGRYVELEDDNYIYEVQIKVRSKNE